MGDDEEVLSPEELHFLDSVNSQDSLGVVIRAHLFIESKLMEVIENALPDPDRLTLQGCHSLLS